MATHSPGDTKGKRKGKGKGKSKAHHTDPPTRVLLQRFYPLVLPLPLYLSALLPQSSSSHGTAHPLVGSNGGLSQPGSSQNTQLWWLSDGDEVPPFPVLNRKGLGTDRTEEMQDTILNALRGLVVCVSDINEAGRLRAILEHQRHDQDPTSPRRASEDEREGFSRDLPWAKQNASGSASGKGQWCEWTPPNAERLSQIEGEDIVELVRHSQQIIVKRILASRSSSSFPDRNVLTAGYKANDGRSGAIRVAGRAPKSLTNFYINTLVTSITTGLEWHALLERPSVTRVSRPTKLASQAQFDLRVRHVLKYIFPRQHGLHNVFTSVVDRTQTTQAFPDYTMRDAEIRARGRAKTPKRLMPIRGMLQTLLRRIDNFDFKRTLNRCCPSRLPRRPMTQSERAEMAADLSEVDPANIATQVQRTIEASQGAFASSQALLQPPRTQLLPAASQRGQNSQSQATVKARLVTERQVKEKPRFYKYAISMGQVSHFVYVVLKSILPRGLLGSQHNMNMVLRRASEFVSGRRYETLSLHEVLQGIRITDIPWLLPVNPRAQAQRSTAVESQLRHELFAELAYWIFDSVLIPLLRTTFYITESAAFRNRTLYFRQDDWAAASAPLLDALKTSLFTPITHREALQVMSGRNLGYSHIRLLPKEAGVRPIVNLRRRSIKQTNPAEAKPSGPYKTEASEKLALNQSINNILQSAFHILTYERSHQPEVMGASVFGMNDIFRCLKRFRAATSHLRKGSEQPRLYFVKVDVQAAFDSIEQGKLLNIVRRILSGEEYLIQRFAEIMPAGGKVKKNFVKRACLDSEHGTFAELAQVLADSLRHVIFVDGVVYGHEERQRVLTLLEQHIEGNLVKIGREFFKQRIGIPQGSSLSTLLCSFFYADMERSDPRLMPVGTVQQHQEIGAAAAAATTQQVSNSSVSMLMRYTDDFLFISTSRRRAKAFFKAMLRGHPEYGCFISPAKTVANFDLSFPDGGFVPQIRERTIKRRRHGGARFTGTAASAGPSEFVRVGAQLPWCGILINTATLAVSSDLSRYEDLHIADTLTVETGRKPGSTLMTKLLQSIQTRSNLILIDTGLNGDVGAHINIYHSCLLAALKLLVYARIIGVDPVSQCDWLLGILKLAATFQYTTIAARVKSAVRNPASPPTRALAKTAGDGSASAATQASSATAKALAVQCSLRQNNVRWLALHAFRRVFSTRPAQWHAVVKALDEEIAAVRPGRGTAAGATTRRGTAATFRLPLTLSSSTKRVAQQDDTPKATLFSADAMELDEDEDGQQAGGAANVGGTAAELAANGPLSLPSSSAHRGAGTTRPCSSSGSSKTARLQALLTTPERAMAAGGAALLAGVRY
ncbi:hypothetical protein OC844_000171 [Tilletia horrida]|nr:hypothetical protein OC844_000171 [Tilletia horrida]